MAGLRCPVCRDAVSRSGEAFPFCSRRCRSVDLGGWLGEAYRVPETPGPDLEGAAIQRLLDEAEDDWPSA